MRKGPGVLTRHLGLLIRQLEKEGLDCSPVLKRAGVSREQLRQREARMPMEKVMAVLRLLADASGRGDLGLVVGRLIGLGQWGDLGQAMLCCATLHDALACCAQHYSLVSQHFSMHMRTAGDCLEITWFPVRQAPYDLLTLSCDMTLAAFHKVIVQILGDEVPAYDVYLPRAVPAHAAAYRAIRPGRCHFGHGGLLALRIEFPLDALQAAMPMADEDELDALRARLDAQGRNAPVQGTWAAWVEMMLTEAADHMPTQQELARIVGLSASALARKLAGEGAVFRQLANDVRHAKACRWLAEGRKVVEVAARLGYGHTPNFVRAFRSVAGMSPSQYAMRVQARRL